MGQTLSEPVTEKHSSRGDDDRLAYGASSMQGWRISMEDAHTSLLDVLSELAGNSTASKSSATQSATADTTTSDASAASSQPASDRPRRFAFFAVYDGHGGSTVAKYSGRNLHRHIFQDPEFQKGNYAAAIKNGFLTADKLLVTDPEYIADPSGCTAVTTLISDDWRVFCGNAGDSRAVLCGKGGVAIPLSIDHKPLNPGESKRIKEAGGYVEFGRVNGNLALSRALGDFEFKQSAHLPAELQIVTADPEIIERQLVPGEDEFIIIACDGIWDCMSNQEVISFIRENVAEGHSLDKVAELLMDNCLAEDMEIDMVGGDNMTVVIVAIIGESNNFEGWRELIRKRLAEEGERGLTEATGAMMMDGGETVSYDMVVTESFEIVEVIQGESEGGGGGGGISSEDGGGESGASVEAGDVKASS